MCNRGRNFGKQSMTIKNGWLRVYLKYFLFYFRTMKINNVSTSTFKAKDDFNCKWTYRL